jgi:hypothetical protein
MASSGQSAPEIPLAAEFYREHFEQARHLEGQRTAISAATLALSGGLIIEALKHGFDKSVSPYIYVLLAINILALFLSKKLYELYRFHMLMSDLVRNQISPSLAGIRVEAEKINRRLFPLSRIVALHWIWESVFVAFILACISLIIFKLH